MAAGNVVRGGAVIGAVLAVLVAAFAWAGGWLSGDRLSPERFITALKPPGGFGYGDRRNHAKGVCVTGTFTADGAATAVSHASLFRPGTYPLIGRFSLGSADPAASDSATRVRGFGFDITGPGGEEWRSANIDVPFFPVATPDAFLQLLQASGSKDPGAIGQVAAAHPELKAFGGWAKSAPWTASFAEEQYNGIDAFVATDAAGSRHFVRWSLLPAATAQQVTPDALKAKGPDFLDRELESRLASGPLHWRMVLTEAAPGDQTADPSQAWPAGRPTVAAGTITLTAGQDNVAGPCRDVNFDPTILPSGLATGDDPFPAARSAVYAVSYNRRTAQEASGQATGGHDTGRNAQ
ncbi:catalase family peroxidase [Lichenicoccus roseus]|uniref:Catalase-related peroxidase n=1 Tax=Lichenicoccus roseus TaxID=2683649 RepID=A0A5R9JCQ7_9PROT|nr:catalase family peroxidase [Lichenicoccus roseus]TLU72068.1 catalase family peroxidase [Lichenicoccus roseus]